MSEALRIILWGIAVAVAAAAFGAIDVLESMLCRRRQMAKDQSSINEAAILWAIRQVESEDKYWVIGAAGERSAYQFKPGTWAIHTRIPFFHATTNPKLGDEVAYRHLSLIIRSLRQRGIEVQPVYIAAAWRKWKNFDIAQTRTDRCRRIANLYFDRTGEEEQP